jgi:hypothetical protein
MRYPTGQAIVDALMAGQQAADLQPWIMALSDDQRDTLRRLLISIRVEVAKTSKGHADEIDLILEEQCVLDDVILCVSSAGSRLNFLDHTFSS